MLKINLETSIDNIAYLDYMQQQEQSKCGDGKTNTSLEILQTTPELKE